MTQKQSAVPFLLQGKNVILVINGKSHTISKDTHMNYGKIIDALKSKDWDALNDLVEPKKAIVNFGMGYVTIDGDKVSWKGQPFHNALSTRMIEMYQEGFPIDPMIRFMENLMKNPSKRSVDQVYGFLEKNKLPITEDGYFLAYKKVQRDTYLDIHSRTISNKIGETVTMDRNLVDDNPDSHCSSGLHFCSESYLSNFGSGSDPVMILKISPEDVVSIPTDYNGAKGRCCKYTVIAQVNGDPKDAFSKIVDQEYVKPPVAALKPAAAWPFPGTSVVPGSNPSCGSCHTGCTCEEVDAELYDVVRVYGGDIEGTGLTFEEAQYRVDTNIRNKKALLQIVKSGTDEVVE